MAVGPIIHKREAVKHFQIRYDVWLVDRPAPVHLLSCACVCVCGCLFITRRRCRTTAAECVCMRYQIARVSGTWEWVVGDGFRSQSNTHTHTSSMRAQMLHGSSCLSPKRMTAHTHTHAQYYRWVRSRGGNARRTHFETRIAWAGGLFKPTQRSHELSNARHKRTLAHLRRRDAH